MTQANLYDALDTAAAQHGGREYIVFGARSQVMTFESAKQGADAWAAYWHALGVRPGDRIAICASNRPEWVYAMFGAARVGAVIVGVSPRLVSRELTHVVNLTKPRAVLSEDVVRGRDRIGVWEDALANGTDDLPRPLTVGISDQHRFYDQWLPGPTLQDVADPVSLTAPEAIALGGAGEYPDLAGVAALMFTSGTTGAPKAVMLSHTSLLRLADAIAGRFGLRPGERMYSVAPFFHCSGLVFGILSSLAGSSTLYTTARYDQQETLTVLGNEAITLSHGATVPLAELVADGQIGSAAFRPPLLNRVWGLGRGSDDAPAAYEEVLGAAVCGLFGLTETGGSSSIATTNDPEAMRHRSIGRPLDGVDMAVMDKGGEKLPEGIPGELVVRGWNVMQGYFRDDAATAAAIDDGGWLHTGDQAIALSNGYFRYVSRLKDILRVGGENFTPTEVEEVLLSHSKVRDAAVVGRPHRRLGEVPVAFIVAARARPSAEELLAYCGEALAQFKRPAEIIFVDELPRTASTNRIQRNVLRTLLESRLPREANMTDDHGRPILAYDDVSVGDQIPELRKGPMTPAHIMRWSAAIENWHRIHYDQPFATAHDGLPDIVINGSWKQHVLCQLLKDWVGPTGRISRLKFEYRSLDVRGDVLVAFGSVSSKSLVDGIGVVTCEIGILNRDIVSTRGTATVLLPLSDGVARPSAPEQVSGSVAEIEERR
jgi:acyl-CoA synthetase (AMP-forming)/AMP-acid ligase II/acyl dehydratase